MVPSLQSSIISAPECSSARSQGASLALWAYAARRHHPGAAAVRALGAAVGAQVQRFSPSELARACAALAALGFRLPPADAAAVAARAFLPATAAARADGEGEIPNPGPELSPGLEGCWAAAAALAPVPEDVVGLLPLRAAAPACAGDPRAGRVGGRWLLAAAIAKAQPPLLVRAAA